MKSSIQFFVVVLTLLSAGTGWTQPQLPVVVTERGPHHRVWSRTELAMSPDGRTRSNFRSFVELATGMHYWKDDQWAESREEIEIFKDGAIARQGQHQVIWSPNLNTAGGIDLLSSDGKHFRSHILGLAFTDAASGQSVLIAGPRDCIGEVAANQVIYRDAFDGGFVADVRYTYTRAGFEQDVIFRESVPSPAEFGLDPATTRLEVWSEFLDPPTPTQAITVLKQESDAQKRQAMADPDLTDETLDFGAMQIGPGTAFPQAGVQGTFPSEDTSPVGKSWMLVEGRRFLIEKLDYRDIQPQLDLLPKAAAVNAPNPEQVQARLQPRPRHKLLAGLRPPVAKESGVVKAPMRMAAASPKARGFVVDYTMTCSASDFRFQGDTTYFVTGDVQLTGLTTIEGGAVVKWTNWSGARIWIKGPLKCLTSSYRPAIFTAKDDGTVGESIPGAASLPTTNAYYGGRYLDFANNTNQIDLRHAHFRYPLRCIGVQGANITITHAQFGHCSIVFCRSPASLILRNVLVHDSETVFNSAGTNHGEHATFHRISDFNSSTSTRRIYLTNSLLVSVTNATYSGDFVGNNLDDSGIFQTVGAGAHYLPAHSAYRNLGTTNVHPNLSKDLKKRTTYPPVVLSGSVTTDTTLSPRAQRDTDIPDLGYHYDPLDFASSLLVVTNATLNLQPGTALATYSSGSGTYGVGLFEGATFLSTGTPDNLNRIVSYNTVQEQATTNWSGIAPGVITYWGSMTTPPQTRFRFTEWSRLDQEGYHYLSYAACEGINDILDCQFHGSQIKILRPKFNFTNCLFNRVWITVDDDFGTYTLTPNFQNITFNGGCLDVLHYSGDPWKLRDNLFDNTIISQDGILDHDYNAYTTNSTRLANNAANDRLVAVANINFEKGPLGCFYLPTDLTSHAALFNNGSTGATLVGLYHFTTVANQAKEASTKVDFGFHYVAVTNGVPFDSDGDRVADYLEDRNGNGLVDGGENNWSNYTSLNGLGVTPGLQVFTPLK